MKRIIIACLVLVLVGTFVGCDEKSATNRSNSGQESAVASSSWVPPVENKNSGNILSFSYIWFSDAGSMRYELTRKGDTAEYSLYYTDDVPETTGDLNPDLFDALDELIQKNEIWRWDGFDEINEDVMDGSGFGLAVEYEQGSIKANGSNSVPENYGVGATALDEFIEKLDIQAYLSNYAKNPDGIEAEYLPSEVEGFHRIEHPKYSLSFPVEWRAFHKEESPDAYTIYTNDYQVDIKLTCNQNEGLEYLDEGDEAEQDSGYTFTFAEGRGGFKSISDKTIYYQIVDAKTAQLLSMVIWNIYESDWPVENSKLLDEIASTLKMYPLAQ